MDNLQAGIDAYKNGNIDESRKCFVAALKENPKNEKAWGALYQVSKDDRERIFCLRKILETNPANDAAKQRLNKLIPPLKEPVTPEHPKYIVPANPGKNGKSNNMLLIGGAAVLLIVCCICGIVFYPTSSTTGTNTSEPNIPIFNTDDKITYIVGGSATSALITYDNEQGGTEQINVRLPWKKEFTVSSSASLTIVAQNGGAGSITCEIWVNGKQTKTSTSTAEYGVVTCADFIY